MVKQRTLADILKALREPTPPDGAEWRVVVKSKDKKRWLWSKYPTGDFVRERLAQACVGGFQILVHEIGQIEKEVLATGAIVVFDPQDRSSPAVSVPGIGGKEKEDYTSWSNARKAAVTNMVKNAALYLGVGLDLHGEQKWTKANEDPEGRPTDDYGRPANGPRKKGKAKTSAKKREAATRAANSNNAKRKDAFTAFWTYVRENDIERQRADEALEKVKGDAEKALILLKEQAGEI